MPFTIEISFKDLLDHFNLEKDSPKAAGRSLSGTLTREGLVLGVVEL